MGRRVADPQVESRVRAWRLTKSLSQQELADRAGLTRQAISAIEGGHYIPNTVVALRIAQVLECRVEDLFVVSEGSTARPIRVVGAVPPGTQRLAVADVRGQWIGYPLASARAIQESFVSADSLLTTDARDTAPHFLTSPDLLERTVLLLGCDPSLGILSTHIARRSSDARVHWLGAPSQAALDAVARGEAHVAGSHMRDAATGQYNVPQARRALADVGGTVVAFTRWEQGFAVLPGNPKVVRSVADLGRPDVRFVNREAGSGSRRLLDELLGEAGLDVAAVTGYERAVTSHFAVAHTVATGGADVGITLRAVAQSFGLHFVPLAEVHFDFIIPGDHLGHPAVSLLCDVLQSQELRRELSLLPGYDVSRLGETVARLPASA